MREARCLEMMVFFIFFIIKAMCDKNGDKTVCARVYTRARVVGS